MSQKYFRNAAMIGITGLLLASDPIPLCSYSTSRTFLENRVYDSRAFPTTDSSKTMPYGIKTLQEKKKRAPLKDKNLERIFSEVYTELAPKIPEYLDEDLIARAILQESNYDPKAFNKKGKARGLFQITKEAWVDAGGDPAVYEEGAFDPRTNLSVGIGYFIWIDNYCSKYHPRWKSLDHNKKRELVVASSNGGAPRLKRKRWDIRKMPKETRDHVNVITNPQMNNKSLTYSRGKA